MWRNETLMLMFELFVRAVFITLVFSAVGGLIMFGVRVYIDSL